MSRQITKTEYISQMVEQKFFSDFRELTSHFSEVPAGITSYLQLNCADELIAISKTPDAHAYRKILCEALATLIDREAFTQLADLNELAAGELESLRKESNIFPEGYVAPTPAPKPLTDAELLEAEVRRDFATLRSEDMRKKRQGNRAYELAYQQIAGTLGSSVTSTYDLGRA